MQKIFADTDVVLDVLTERQPHYPFAARLFSLGERKEIRIYLSAITIVNIDYILRRQKPTQFSRTILKNLAGLVTVLPVDQSIILKALDSGFADFEDAVQYHCALQNNISIIVTRNLKDYKKAEISVLTPQQFIAL